MKHIATLTMNPAIDKSASVERVAPEIKMTTHSMGYDPGGGGINVSRAAKRLGAESMAIFPAGGYTGILLEELLGDEGINCHPIKVAGATRENFTAFDESTTLQYRFGMPGSKLTEAEWERCISSVKSLSPVPEFIVVSGSLPPGVPDDFYLRVSHIVQEIGAKLILDTSGSALYKTIDEGGVFLAKPNIRELGLMTGETLEDETILERVTRRLVDEGKVQNIVVSLGAAGALLVTSEHYAYLRSPTVPIQSKVGAGDSMVGGIVRSLAMDWPILEAARYGVASGAAAVMTPGTQLCHQDDVERLYQRVSS